MAKSRKKGQAIDREQFEALELEVFITHCNLIPSYIVIDMIIVSISFRMKVIYNYVIVTLSFSFIL